MGLSNYVGIDQSSNASIAQNHNNQGIAVTACHHPQARFMITGYWFVLLCFTALQSYASTTKGHLMEE